MAFATPKFITGDVIDHCLRTLKVGDYRAIEQYLLGNRSSQVIQEAVIGSFPGVASPLILWLFGASALPLNSAHKTLFLYRLGTLEKDLRQLEDIDRLRSKCGDTSSWRSKASEDLAPKGVPVRDVRWANVTRFHSTLFEVSLVGRLTRGSGYLGRFRKTAPDIIISNESHENICGIECYAPQQGLAEEFAEDDQQWTQLVGSDAMETAVAPAMQISKLKPHQRASFSPSDLQAVVPQAIYRLTRLPTFEKKRQQLDDPTLPTFCAIRLYHLDVNFGGIMLDRLAQQRRSQGWTTEVFDTLPPSCLGFLVCAVPDYIGGSERVQCFSAPGKTISEAVEAFLDAAEIETIPPGR